MTLAEQLANQQRKLTSSGIVLAAILAALFCIGLNFWHYSQNQLTTTRLLAAQLSLLAGQVDSDSAQQHLDTLQAVPSITAAQALDANGTTLAQFDTSTASTLEVSQTPATPGADWQWQTLIVHEPFNAGEGVGSLVVSFSLLPLLQQLLVQLCLLGVATFALLAQVKLRVLSTLQHNLAPLHQLVNLSQKAPSAWDPQALSKLEGSSDVKALAQRLQTLQLELNENQQRLTAQDGNLEQLVLQRTKDLQLAAQAAANASQAKTNFLTTVSHEIRTPLNGMLGMLELLLASHLTQEQRQMAQVSQNSGRQLVHIINDILDFSKIEAGYLQLESLEFDLPALLDELLLLLRPNLQQKQLALDLTLSPTPFVYRFVGDSLRLRQILLNLLGNAIKFTERGRISVNVWASHSGLSQAKLKISVQDTGIGISKEAQLKIFDHFIQAESTTTRRFGGTGLGLAICKRLVELMQGRLWVESAEGNGSTFWLELDLPVIDNPLPSTGNHAASAVLLSEPTEQLVFSGKVLLAEDNLINQRLGLTMLNKLGLHTDLAANGAEAIKLASAATYDLILMDCQMPVMDGFDACHAIRAAQEQSKHTLPIIALSADATAATQERCTMAGMDDFLAKPYSFRQLEAMLNKWLGNANATKPLRRMLPLLDEQLPVINRSTINQLRAIDPAGSNCLVRELLQAFMENSITLMQKLEVAVAQQDSENLYRTAQSLHSNAEHLGAEPLARYFQQLETFGQHNQLDTVAQHLPLVQQCFDDSLAQLRQIIKEL